MQTRFKMVLSVLTFVVAAALTLSANSSFASSEAKSLSTVGTFMKVPSQLRANMPIDAAVKTFLDRDFRSRYPVASPFRTDVVDSWVDAYSIQNVADGYGGYDTRHYFHVMARHVTGSLAYMDVYIYQRTQVEPDQDPILLERFEVVGWQR